MREHNGPAGDGMVVAVRGSVVDVHFPDRLPSLYHLLRTGDEQRIAVEVSTYLDDSTVRGIALTSTRGLARGARVVDTGSPLRVPVGPRLLGRVLNVFGETIDRKAGGIAVSIGARVGGLAGPSEILASSTVKDLVAGSGLTFEDTGEHELKGVPDRWKLYRVVA